MLALPVMMREEAALLHTAKEQLRSLIGNAPPCQLRETVRLARSFVAEGMTLEEAVSGAVTIVLRDFAHPSPWTM